MAQLERLLGGEGGDHCHAQLRELALRAELECAISQGRRERNRFLAQGVAFSELSVGHEPAGQLEQQLDALTVLRLREGDGPPEQADPAACVSDRDRSTAGGCEPFRRPQAELLVGRAELLPVAVGLLEVVADDLVELDERRAVPLQPHGEALVQIGPGRLGQRVVRRIADQEVAKAVGVLADELRLVGADQLLAHEIRQPALDAASRRAPSACTAPRWKTLPFDSATLEHPALGRLELVEPRREQRLDRRRHGTSPSPESSHAVRPSPRRRAGCLRPLRGCAPGDRGRASSSLSNRSSSSSVSVEDNGSSRMVVAFSLPPPQPGTPVQEFRPREAQQQEGRLAREVGHVLQQVEEGRLGPVDVVEHGHERATTAAASPAACGRPTGSPRTLRHRGLAAEQLLDCSDRGGLEPELDRR